MQESSDRYGKVQDTATDTGDFRGTGALDLQQIKCFLCCELWAEQKGVGAMTTVFSMIATVTNIDLVPSLLSYCNFELD